MIWYRDFNSGSSMSTFRNSASSTILFLSIALVMNAFFPFSARTEDSGLKPKLAPCISWRDTAQESRAVLLCIHGLGLHKGTFEALGKEMAKAGLVTYAIDMRGFGESQETKKRTELDFDGCLLDVKLALEQIHKENPGLPVIILGESMGGAIALRATALYPELISGLISCVPARDRFSLGESALKVGVHVLSSGFNTPIENVGESVIKRATKNPDLHRRWKSDPLVRLSYSARELLQFDEFMSQNFKFAGQIKNKPVLFIMGAKDKLIRPAGTWSVFEQVASPKRQLVLSTNSEHLIFEEGQFNPEDLSFVKTWINNNVATLNPSVIAGPKQQPAVSTAEKPLLPATTETQPVRADATINYWIELCRDEKFYRCNNKYEFRSGDLIRFHLIPESDGYAYLLMSQGSSGKRKMLFPTPESGKDNFFRKGRDYSVPSNAWMQLDKTPGTEMLNLVFSKEPLNISPETIQPPALTCYVSPELSGAKDLVPTRMKLSWDDPKPVLLPEDFNATSQISALGKTNASSLVRLVSSGGYLSLDVALLHR